jgi:predicted nucleic acid-binding protein
MIVCLDTNIVIYLIEANPVWTPKASARISALLTAGDEVGVCDAARLECLVKPLATGNAADEASYRKFFGTTAVRMLPVTPTTWERAAQLAATFHLKAMDAVHLSAAMERGCGMFLTADAKLKKCTAIPVEILT